MKYILFILIFSFQASALDLVKLHQQHHQSVEPQQDTSKLKKYDLSSHGISQIGLQKTACYGRCPSFTVIINKDGSVYYSGQSNVEKVGEFTGQLPVYLLNDLFAYINEIHYQKLQDTYSSRITDHASVYTMVKYEDKQKVIKNYANTGPLTLWALQQLVEALLPKVQWHES